ncbi:putative acid phosphatase [Kockovaella imperatae]|uniref:Purple acid phosphatase n=1 Tax=Kockovaella imperatae TaxID=4999 RepID=A0A1Y1UUC0_9TREE|nr:putative acid phosphatase [Kockovaella imperatae]ORX41237.1 putative acid phosphatase [Kockovaella imperatae]
MSLRLVSLFALLSVLVSAAPTVNTKFPYVGPAVPIGDWVDQTINGNGQGFPRLVEAPAVQPSSENVTNNINVISLAYIPGGMHIHFQTPFGIDGMPMVSWGEDATNLCKNTTGYTTTYDRTPACSQVAVTQCSQFFHEVSLPDLKDDTTYYYQIPGGNGTTPSQVMSFKTGLKAGCAQSFSVAVINDMGYTNALGTHTQLLNLIQDGAAFVWHGGDSSYADDWYSGILPCEDDWPVCYNGSSTELPGPAPVPAQYLDAPLPAGEVANQGGPQGGDMNVIYESNWDLWQQWMNNITTQVPYMLTPGNHEASCAEFDGQKNELSAYLDNDIVNGTLNSSTLSYWSCPESQRNFTAYQYRFRMPGNETGGVSNFWYSFDYGLAHFISFDGETDYYQSPEYPFIADLKPNETIDEITKEQTYPTDSGPFGNIDNMDWRNNTAYEQYQWLKQDLESVDRTKTPWVFVMNHRPMYSSEVSSYQLHMRNAFEQLFLDNCVDAFIAGHVHWYERMWPMGRNGSINWDQVLGNDTYHVGDGSSIVHLTNGQAGNVESHSILSADEPVLPLTNVLNFVDFGLSKLTVINETAASFEFIRGADGSQGDYLMMTKAW